MAERLFGIETEYALAALGADGSVVDRGPLLQQLISAAGHHYAAMPDSTGRGVFLGNGARFYIDAPDHPEMTTPECANPWDAVRYVRAGERILHQLAQACVGPVTSSAAVFITRCNVDYSGSSSTWGTHESYLHRTAMRPLFEHILPHLVSRIVYTGAGGFNSRFVRGLQFTLSPRVWHLEADASDQSTQGRGIFHTKDEPLSRRGNKRLHIISGESLCSERAAWLKVATTALVVALADAQLFIGEAVSLHDPLAAMKSYASDPTCRATATLRHGGVASALDIQRAYLSLAEKHAQAEFMPPWAGEACAQWRAILNDLEQAPAAVASQLDWGIKLALYRSHAQRRGVDWNTIEHWNHVAAKLGEALNKSSYPDKHPTVEVILDPHGPISAEVQRQEAYLRRHRLSFDGFVPFLELRQELFEIDARFGALGGNGIFDTLERSGLLTHHVAGVDNIEHAIHKPPALGRANLRGRLIQEHRDNYGRYICDWSSIYDAATEKAVDLSDPFATEASWKPRNDVAHADLEFSIEDADLTEETPAFLRRRRRSA